MQRFQVVWAQEGRQRDRQEGMHQMSWAVSAGSLSVAQALGCEGIKLELNDQLTSSGKRVSQAGGKQYARSWNLARIPALSFPIPSSVTELRALLARTC